MDDDDPDDALAIFSSTDIATDIKRIKNLNTIIEYAIIKGKDNILNYMVNNKLKQLLSLAVNSQIITKWIFNLGQPGHRELAIHYCTSGKASVVIDYLNTITDCNIIVQKLFITAICCNNMGVYKYILGRWQNDLQRKVIPLMNNNILTRQNEDIVQSLVDDFVLSPNQITKIKKYAHENHIYSLVDDDALFLGNLFEDECPICFDGVGVISLCSSSDKHKICASCAKKIKGNCHICRSPIL